MMSLTWMWLGWSGGPGSATPKPGNSWSNGTAALSGRLPGTSDCGRATPQIVREALAQLPSRWQQLMDLLMADPPIPYAEIADKLGLPIGSIGPTRGRCLARLRVLLETV